MPIKGIKRSAFALVLAASLAVVSACSNSSTGSSGDSPEPSGSIKKTVNVGVTYAPSGINPLAPVGLVSTYVASLMFPPLVDLDSDLEYKPMLADSIETANNKTFVIKLNPGAKWTDGTPVTSDDVIFTLGLMSNAKVASNYAYMFAIVEGLDDSGYLPEGRTDIGGVKKVDEHTLTITTKAPTTIRIFKDTIGKNLLTLPQAALKDIAPEDINKSDFMQKPGVTSGPFKIASIDRDHYVQMTANKDYFKGAPKLEQLNFKVLQGTAVAAQLQSGEIDMNIPSAGVIPVSDYEKVKGLGNVTTVEGQPLATQFMYINEKAVPDAKQRQAISYAMNREMIVEKLLHGAGEVVDGFFTSYSPYKDGNVQPAAYDPEKAKSLLQESGWDAGKTLRMYVLSGDATLEQASNIIAENLKAAGVKVQIQMMDLATLIDKLVKMDYDLGILTVSLTPINPLPDLAYFLNEGNPSGYKNADVEKLIASIGAEVDEAKIAESYSKLQQLVAQDVPMPSIYAAKALGAVNKRVSGAQPKDFGMFINVNEWDVK
ncbi:MULTISPECIES: ABC transporter substrate-binding protein [unclassified Paenibacillus]|uniref:ABC transporter substrate-binding protein n=1 Tax=unclassified Paenibacillus TaxID=185978 RepID=UPI0009557AB9|nr:MULTISPECIES: ABC transporter substrate-binding protein [unclassified Paenibacillus]ASS67787.2 ABC transporter substrate-binding protein [Paenibacillus sp. RUD330]SIR60772.1 peptide/nickel transport system substrate-binding protein [Paenibacillus sp. RU4X]SIR69509.1 peptide/nickel transport system substrate-binding protein [Paenibacillus sp. RU4T]